MQQNYIRKVWKPECNAFLDRITLHSKLKLDDKKITEGNADYEFIVKWFQAQLLH